MPTFFIQTYIYTYQHVGEPLPPENIHNAAQDGMPSTTIIWDPPVYTGGDETFIQMYRMRIPEISYSEEEDGTARSHTITANGTGVIFNTPYEVEVTAINKCEYESDPVVITVNIEAGGN